MKMRKAVWFCLLLSVCLTGCKQKPAESSIVLAQSAETTTAAVTEQTAGTTVQIAGMTEQTADATEQTAAALTSTSDSARSESDTSSASSGRSAEPPSSATTAASAKTVSETTAAATTASSAEPPENGRLVRILDYIPDAVIDLRYATENNFTGKVIYSDDEAYICYGTLKKLIAVQDELREMGYRILIWDAYRPPEAQQRLWDVCPNPTYVANPSRGITSHSRGDTVDISMVYADGSPVEMPSEFDEFSAVADRDYRDVSEAAGKNAALLETVMTRNGFKGYRGEWWDYSDTERYTLLMPQS